VHDINWRLVYPLFVLLWLALSAALNEWAHRLPSHFSTRLAIDDHIPFVPRFAWPYFSAYVLGNLGYVLLWRHVLFGQVMLGYLLLFLGGTLCYVLLPCRVQRCEALPTTALSTRLLAAFQRRSRPYNSFPSMHTAYCLFSALMVLRYHSFWLGIILLLWGGVVALATLLTKQHHLADVIAGALLAVFAGRIGGG